MPRRPAARAAIDAQGRITGAVAGEPGFDRGVDRAGFADAAGRSAPAPRALAVGQDAATHHPDRIAELVELDTVDVAEPEIADMHGREPAVLARAAGSPGMHEEERVHEPGTAMARVGARDHRHRRR